MTKSKRSEITAKVTPAVCSVRARADDSEARILIAGHIAPVPSVRHVSFSSRRMFRESKFRRISVRDLTRRHERRGRPSTPRDATPYLRTNTPAYTG